MENALETPVKGGPLPLRKAGKTAAWACLLTDFQTENARTGRFQTESPPVSRLRPGKNPPAKTEAPVPCTKNAAPASIFTSPTKNSLQSNRR